MKRPFRSTAPATLAVIVAWLATSCGHGQPVAPVQVSADASSQVVITLAPGADARALADAHGATLLRLDAANGLALLAPADGQSPDELALALSGSGGVTTAEPNSYVSTAESQQKSFAFDDGQGSWSTTVEQPATGAIGLDAAHAVTNGAGVKVAVLDTGIDPAHPLFAGKIAASADFLDPANTAALDLTNGVDDDGNGEIDEAFGHGTHVAGLVTLLAPEARLLVGRVLDADGRGDVLAVAAGIRWAVRNGADVINLSLGTTATVRAIGDALEEAEEAGVLVVAAAGNRGSDHPTEYPARSKYAIAVAATDAKRKPATFTSYGDFVAISAPGVGVRSAYPGGLWRLWSGTSMSAPLVSGTIALLRANHPTWKAEQMVQRLRETSLRLDEPSADRREKLGSGMMHAGAALAPDLPPGLPGDPGPIDAVRRPS